MTIMKKNIIVSMLMATALLSGCDYNDKYFDGLQDGDVPLDVKKLDYTLTADDYAAISTNKTNESLAGEENKAALAALKTNMYFSGAITADKYLPAFLAAQWYTADDLSLIHF